MKLELRELLEQTAAALLAGSEDHPELELLPPRKAEHGDLASDIGFKLSKVLKRSPLVLAEEARRILEKELKPRALGREIREIRIVPPGYLNFYFSPRFFARILEEIAGRDGRYGESEAGAQRPVLLEYVSANPTGPLTIAHGRQACIGDALARILRMAGYRPHREYYMNDAGRQMNLLGRSLHAR
jgi:arginyl-tRNA synthetase